MERKDISGQRFERLVAVRPVGKSPTGHILWECKCDCGNSKNVSIGQWKRTRSCGCLATDVTRERSVVHGATHSKTHNVWCQMRRRSREKKGYEHIDIDPIWEKSFAAFLEHMGLCPEGLTIDRIDNTKGYFPGNCRWATAETQANNRSNNVIITFAGETLTAAQWSKRTGLQAQTIRYRINKGWPVHEALFLPTR